MKYTTEKKQTIVLYILEKIVAETQSLSKVVAETFNISTNTVHTYLNELLESGIIPCGMPPQKLRINIQDHPPIGNPAFKFRPVDTTTANQHHISRHQAVAVALHHVDTAAGTQQKKLAEFVVMIFGLGSLGVLQMK